MASLQLNVNGVNHVVEVSNPDMPLLWVLRDLLGLTGTKYGCGIEVCGACSVLVDGQTEHSCVFNASDAVGRQVVTIEGLSPNRSHPVQRAWISHQVPQCGYCQSGMIMATVGAMNAGHSGSEIIPEIQHICVCGTYQRIKAAVSIL